MARILKALLPIAVLGAGVAVAGFLVVNAPEPEPDEVVIPPKVVETLRAQPGAHRVKVPAMGIVRAEREVTLIPEVAGVIVQQSENLVDGGLVAVGDPLVRLDSRDLATQLKLTESELAQARLAVREETQQVRVAEAEWKDLPKGFSEESREYVMREPHLDAAKARVSSVRDRIKKAKRDLHKTILRAPFDGVVVSESADLGQLVGPGSPVARIAGVDRFWVQVSIPVSHLQFIDVPGINAIGDEGSKAEVAQPGATAEAPREGRVLRVLPSVEERGRMAQVLVAVDDPLGLELPPGERPTPLLVGTYVQLEIEGKVLEDVVPIPRKALRDDEHVFVVGADGKLETRNIEIAWRERGRVLVKKGLEAGDRVVVTPLPMATDGMKVDVSDAVDVEQGAAKPEPEFPQPSKVADATEATDATAPTTAPVEPVEPVEPAPKKRRKRKPGSGAP